MWAENCGVSGLGFCKMKKMDCFSSRLEGRESES